MESFALRLAVKSVMLQVLLLSSVVAHLTCTHLLLIWPGLLCFGFTAIQQASLMCNNCIYRGSGITSGFLTVLLLLVVCILHLVIDSMV